MTRSKKIYLVFSTIALCIFIIFLQTDVRPQSSDSGENVLPKKEESKKITTPPAQKKVEYFTLNFKDVDISEFLNMMGQLVGKNIIIDDNVRGKITISSAKRIPVTEAFNVMKSILEVKGLAVIETENILKVLPIREAIKKNIEVIVDGKKIIKLDAQKTVTYLLEVENADATLINQALMPLKSQFTDLVVYPTLNIIIMSGPSTEIDGLIKIARALDRLPDKTADKKTSNKGNIHVVHLQYAAAEELANVMSRVPFSEVAFVNTEDPAVRASAAAQRVTGVPPQQQQKSKLSIIASKETNSLIITATPNEFIEIQKLIDQLDVVREQVLIEALIVEVSAESGFSLGVDWYGAAGFNIGGQKVGAGASSINNGSGLNFTSPSGLNKSLAMPLNTGFQVGFLFDKSLLSYALLNASQSDTNFNVLSTPQILTIDNQEAELNVGEQIPVPSSSTTGTTGVTQYSYDYKSVGVKLKLTPHITSEQYISLDLYQEANQVIGTITTNSSGNIVPPTLAKRDIKTKITVADGKTIVVGGLIKNSKTVTEAKVPLLGDIPLLGWLFKHKSESTTKTNLLVFITPHLVTKQSQIDSVTQQKKDEQKLLRESK
jgi:general secretion pathway protein D